MSFFLKIHVQVFLFCFATVDLLFRFCISIVAFFQNFTPGGEGERGDSRQHGDTIVPQISLHL